MTSDQKRIEQVLDGWDLARLEADTSAMLGHEDRPHKTFRKGRKAPNISWEELIAKGTCDAAE